MKEMMNKKEMKAVVKFLIPFCLAGFAVLFFSFTERDIYTKYAMIFSIYNFMPLFGTETAIATGLTLGIPPVGLICFILFMDAVISLFLVWNFDYAKKIPGIGKLIERAEEGGKRAIRKYKWAKRFDFLGLVFFITIPLQYTGGAVGSIVGRLIGMTPWLTWLAVVIGSSLRSTFITLVSIGVLSFL
jgi:uncharacterized membrane protein